MKGMQRVRRGSGFKGVLAYLLDHDEPEIIAGTISPGSAVEMTSEFIALSETRNDIAKPVWHNSLRLPKGDTLDKVKWTNIVEEYMHGMGFSSSSQWIAIRHNHPDGEHIHIVANRVKPDGKVYLGKNENLISTKIIKELEILHELTVTKSVDYDVAGNIVMPQKKSPKKTRSSWLFELENLQAAFYYSHQ